MADLRVSDQYRTNPLSLKPGGCEVIVVFENGKRFIYDKIKKPQAYVRNISTKETEHGRITEVLVDGGLKWKIDSNRDPWDFSL